MSIIQLPPERLAAPEPCQGCDKPTVERIRWESLDGTRRLEITLCESCIPEVMRRLARKSEGQA